MQAQGGNGISCVVLMKIEEDMKAPVYFYYQLHNYYQNHRRYMYIHAFMCMIFGDMQWEHDHAATIKTGNKLHSRMGWPIDFTLVHALQLESANV